MLSSYNQREKVLRTCPCAGQVKEPTGLGRAFQKYQGLGTEERGASSQVKSRPSGSSPCSAAETNLTMIHEDEGLISGLAQ